MSNDQDQRLRKISEDLKETQEKLETLLTYVDKDEEDHDAEFEDQTESRERTATADQQSDRATG